MNYLLTVVAYLSFMIFVFIEGRRHLHMLQLEGYKNLGYVRWIKRSLNKLLLENLYLFIFILLALVLKGFSFKPVYEVSLLLVWVLLMFYLSYRKFRLRKNVKKPLVFTFRAIRIFSAFMALEGALGFLLSRSVSDISSNVMLLSLLMLLIPLVLILANLLVYPIEMLVQMRYLISAKRKMRSLDHIISIGITGSYGKTSTKYFTATVLSERYSVLMTPASYNTLMGVTKVIRESLSREHDIFVCEMGARYRGDIRDLVKLVRPKIGVITSIGPQHLETLKTMDNIVKTKFELIEGLPTDGIAVLNGDNEYCTSFYKHVIDGRKVFFYGYQRLSEDLFVWAEDIRTTKRGLEFIAKVRDGREIRCLVPILGRHNVGNLLAAITVALILGLDVKEIERGLRKITPVPHRLQLVDSGSGITVIDDSFNSNPVGFIEALNCLKEIEGGRKVIVTPGLIELGEIEYEENRKIGRLLAQVCDYVILVGRRRSKPLLEGLEETGFPKDRVKVVSNLDEAKAELAHILRPGDVVMFENDLPDNYTE